MIDQETLKTFDELYTLTYSPVLKYIVCNCHNIADVQDIVQNTYMELLKKYKSHQTFPQTKSYVLGIAKNKVKEFYRFHYKTKIISFFTKEKKSLEDNIPADFNLQDNFIQKEDLEFIWQYLKKQKPIVAKVFYLYYYADYKIEAIAKELNMTPSNVKNYLYRTLKELDIFLNKRGEN